MTITSEFLAALERASESVPGDRAIPWPSPGRPGHFYNITNFIEWKKIILECRLSEGVPPNMKDMFDRALKLYLATWLDFDLVIAGEMATFAALEHSLRDSYLGLMRQKHNQKVIARAKAQKQGTKPAMNFRPENIKLADLLKYMREHDGLTDEQLPFVRKYGGSIMRRLTGEVGPSFAELRNIRAHGNPFGSGYLPGFPEVVRDLIEYAYRDKICMVAKLGITHSG